MIPDDPELRHALAARSGQPTEQSRARIRQALTAGPHGTSSSGLLAAVAVVVVILLTATSVAAVVAYRHANRGAVASGPRVMSPSPAAESHNVYLSTASSGAVWALVDYAKLYVSTDRAGHWEARQMPPSIGIKPTISFINDLEGWLLAPGSPTTQCGEAAAAIWHTNDGAKTWHELMTAGLGTAQCKEVIYFSPDARHGFVAAWDDNHQPVVYWSVDGGVGWKKATLPDPPDYKSAPGGFNLRVQWIKALGDTFYLEAYGSQGAESPYPDVRDRQYIYQSINGGGTWVWKQKVPSRELVVITASRWLAIEPARLDESTNGGQQMHLFDSNLVIDRSATPGQILFADDSVGYVSRGGVLQRTLDGGAHWTAVGRPGATSPTPNTSASPMPRYFVPTPVQLDAPTHDVVWAYIPLDKALFVSTDRGDHWETRNLPPEPSNSFPNITFVDAEEGWYLGAGSGNGGAGACATERVQIWHTVDGAQTWQSFVSTGISDAQCKSNLVFADRTHAFMTSQEEDLMPRVYRSTDGGHNWSWTALSDPADFESEADGFILSASFVRTLGTTLLVEASGNAALSPKAGSWAYRSDDGGGHWVLATTLPAIPVRVVFLSATRWLMFQGPSGALETTNAGKTWHEVATDYSDAAGVAPDFVFADSQVGYATVRGDFHRTLDGGAHWTMPPTPWMPPA
jgi:photosystem II stability/assembly factor-like uncharacterized protein